MNASGEMNVDKAALVWVFVDMFWMVIVGIICYTVFACLARIVGGLYIIQKQRE